MAMIFYCEPFYQLASLGRIRLAGLPEKIFQSPTRLHGDSTRMRTPKATKTRQKIGKKTTAIFDEMIQCIATSLKTQIRLIIMFPTKWASQTRGFFTRLPNPNKSDFGYTSKYSHEVLPIYAAKLMIGPRYKINR